MLAMDKLKKRVQAGLSNPEFVEPRYDELYITALGETDGIVGNKDLADAFEMDIAYYRFLLLADAGATEQDESNYKMALGALKSAKYLSTDETTGESVTAARVMVKARKSGY